MKRTASKILNMLYSVAESDGQLKLNVNHNIRNAQKALYEDLMAVLPKVKFTKRYLMKDGTYKYEYSKEDQIRNGVIEETEAILAQYFGVDKEETNG